MKKAHFRYGSDEEAMVRRVAAKRKEGHGVVLEARSQEEVSSVVAREERAEEPESIEQQVSLTREILTRLTSRGETSEVSPRRSLHGVI